MKLEVQNITTKKLKVAESYDKEIGEKIAKDLGYDEEMSKAIKEHIAEIKR